MNENKARRDPLLLLDDFCTLVAIGLLAFSVYILPHVFFGYIYPVPDFAIMVPQWLQENYNLSVFACQLILFTPFFLGSVTFFALSKLITSYLEVKYPEEEPKIPATKVVLPDHVVSFTSRMSWGDITAIILLVVMGVLLIYVCQYWFAYLQN